jgi:hypothetical protein
VEPGPDATLHDRNGASPQERRIVFTAFTDSLASSVIPYLLYSDDHGATVKSPIALPIPEASNFCRYHRPFENPDGARQLYAPCYFYRKYILGSSRSSTTPMILR